MTTAGPYWLWAGGASWMLFSAAMLWGDLVLSNKNDRVSRVIVFLVASANTVVGVMLARTVGWL